MFAVSAAERRFGPAIAGAMAAMPVALSIIVLAVGAELGADAGATLAAGAAAHDVAQVAVALAFATVLMRRGASLGLLAGVAAFALVSLLVEPFPTPLAIALALPALRMKGSDPLTKRNRPEQGFSCENRVKGSDPSTRAAPVNTGPVRGATALGAAAAAAMVAAALGTAELAGPAAAGMIGAFPALSTAFAVLLVRTRGREAAASALRGLIGGLRAYLVFTVTVAVTAPGLGVYTAVPLALALCLMTYAVLFTAGSS
jgi:hypothetical protein